MLILSFELAGESDWFCDRVYPSSIGSKAAGRGWWSATTVVRQRISLLLILLSDLPAARYYSNAFILYATLWVLRGYEINVTVKTSSAAGLILNSLLKFPKFDRAVRVFWNFSRWAILRVNKSSIQTVGCIVCVQCAICNSCRKKSVGTTNPFVMHLAVHAAA